MRAHDMTSGLFLSLSAVSLFLGYLLFRRKAFKKKTAGPVEDWVYRWIWANQKRERRKTHPGLYLGRRWVLKALAAARKEFGCSLRMPDGKKDLTIAEMIALIEEAIRKATPSGV